jgi:predicted nucleic acid-binding protein
MEIVVNDTNIFIDLYSINFLDYLFQLPINVHTVDFVINEIKNKEQLNCITEYIKKGLLNVHRFTSEELTEVSKLYEESSGNVSLVDCSVWYYAKRNNYVLLTGDRQLRIRAINSNVTVKGIIYVFDTLIENKLIDSAIAANKLEELFQINQRLPKTIIQERINLWRKNKSLV